MKNNKEMKNENSDNIAAMGIGAMIVFIALILVAAVASAVIIQTAEKLQQNAQTAGEQTQDQMASKVMPLNIVINAAGTLQMTWELAPGSETIPWANIEWSITCQAGGVGADAGTFASAGTNTAAVSANGGTTGLPGQVYQTTLLAANCAPTTNQNHFLTLAAGNSGFTYEVLTYGSSIAQGTVVV